MKQNVGGIDRILRILVGVTLMGLVYADQVNGIIGTVILILGIILSVTGVIGYCPLYALLGINTSAWSKKANHQRHGEGVS